MGRGAFLPATGQQAEPEPPRWLESANNASGSDSRD
jgi:hypothetical protein